VAFYDESYVERVKLIKELQRKKFLPLDVIREIISSDDSKLSEAERELISEAKSGIAKLDDSGDEGECEPKTLAELSQLAELPEEEILELERCEIISSFQGEDGAKNYPEHDIRIAQAFAKCRKGDILSKERFEVETFRLQSDLIAMMALEETRRFIKSYSGQPAEYGTDLLAKNALEAVEDLNDFICQIHRKQAREALKSFGVEDDS
jgi:DNA-binding transcriptional MerR regulator